MQPRLVSPGFHGTRGKPLRWVLPQPGLAEDPVPTLSPSLCSLPPPAGPRLAAGCRRAPPPPGTASLADHSGVPGPGNGFGLSRLAPAAAHPSSQPLTLGFWVARGGAEAVCSPRGWQVPLALPRAGAPGAPGAEQLSSRLAAETGSAFPGIQAFMWEPTVAQPPPRNHRHRPLAFSWFL